jgi:hypothetical protein
LGRVRRYLALTAALLTAAAITAPAALADSIVYEKEGNIWEAAPDGTNQRQITTSGGYSKPTQAADGTIVAVKNKLLERLDRSGNVRNLAGDSEYTGPLTPSIAPGGALVAYNFNKTTGVNAGMHATLSYADRETDADEVFNIGGWSNPSWIGNDKILMFDGSEPFSGSQRPTP